MPKRTEELQISTPSGSFSIYFTDKKDRADFIWRVDRSVSKPTLVHNAYGHELYIRPSAVHMHHTVN